MTGLPHRPANQVILGDQEGRRRGSAREGGGVEIVNYLIIFPVVCGVWFINYYVTHPIDSLVWLDYEGLLTPDSDSQDNIERSVPAKFCHLF